MQEKVRILLVEDEFITLETLTSVLTEMGYAISGDAMSAAAALDVLDNGDTDLAILDINIKGVEDGIWLAGKIRKSYDIPFIFLTAFGDPATVERAIETKPYGYLVKPFTKVDVYAAIEVALKNFARQRSDRTTPSAAEDKEQQHEGPVVIKDSIFVRDDHMYVKLKIEDILFIKSDKNYLEIHVTGKRHLVRGKLSDFVANLPEEKFMKVHRSHVVNVDAIDRFGGGFLVINNTEVPLGEPYKKGLKERLRLF